MKKKSKPKRILDAFTKNSDVPKEILEERRSICDGCEFNSKNVHENQLTFLKKLRKQTFDQPFCLACGCQVNEKTSQAVEECGLAEKGEEPKWRRIKIETSSRWDLNLINLSEKTVNTDISRDGERFEVLYGQVPKGKKISVDLVLQSKKGTALKKVGGKPTCSTCTELDITKTDNRVIEFTVTMDPGKLPVGNFNKSVVFNYELNKKSNRIIVSLIGEVVEDEGL